MRFRDTVKISFTKEVQREIRVPPLLFMAFVENAFKHGAIISGLMEVIVFLKCDRQHITLVVKNTILPSQPTIESHGLGISTTKRRLDVLYPNAYTLDITKTKDWYEVSLKISVI